MKNIKTQTLLLWSIMSIMIASCSDEFTDETTEYFEDSENYFNSEQDYYSALVSAYDLLQSTYVNVMLGEIASDNTIAGGESATDVPGFQQIDKMIHTPVNSNLKNVWDWMFAGVYRASYVIEFQDKTDFEGKEQLLAEARFLRAYYNFELVKWFGPIPIKREGRFFRGDETSSPRSSVSEVYAFIEEDLGYAIANMSSTAPQVGRATKGAAQALLGKAYLYQNKFSEAASVLDQVITTGGYQLETDYNKIFEAEGENGVGSVFEVQYTDVEGAGFGCLQCSEGNVAVGFNGIRNYNGPDFDSGFSFNLPVQEVFDAFEDGDIRRDVAILDIEEWASATGATFVIGYQDGHTGYYNRKYIARKGDLNTGDANLTNPNNYRAIRFADVLLMAAEAHNRKPSPNTGLAQQYLNRVRERAELDPITETGSALTEAIYQERNVELVGEGHRFFDLVRTGNGATIAGFEVGKNEVFPIPVEEIRFSKGNWSQNSGY